MSADVPIGLPFNIASYALLTMMMAQSVNMVAKEFIHTFGDVHIYSNQLEAFKSQLLRTPMPLPQMRLNKDVRSVFDFQPEDFEITNYEHHPAITYPVAV